MSTQIHPTLARFIARFAIAETSTAKTPKGVLAAIRKHGMPPLPRSFYSARIKWRKVAIADPDMGGIAWERSRSLYPRKSNWTSTRPVVGDHYDTQFDTFRYAGKHSGRTGSNGVPCYPSYLAVARRGAVAQLFQEGKLIVTRYAPKGLQWKIDELGAYLIDSKGLDYHPTVADIKARNFAALVRAGLKAKRDAFRKLDQQARKDKTIEQTLKNKDRLSRYWVTREDSLSGGNCRMGTDRFIDTVNRVLGDGIGAIRADVLLDKWSSPAVEKAVRAAVARQL